MPIFIDFRNFLIKNKVFITVIGLLLGEEIRGLSRSFVTNLIEPIFDLDLNNDGTKDTSPIFSKSLSYKGMTFRFGKVLKDSLHFFIMIVIAFVISIITRNLIDADD